MQCSKKKKLKQSQRHYTPLHDLNNVFLFGAKRNKGAAELPIVEEGTRETHFNRHGTVGATSIGKG
jgi:hypothetical protein